MGALYAVSDIVLCCSLQPEAFGRTIVEAQSMASLVISTDQGHTPDLICHGQTGFLIPLDNPEKASQTLAHALSLSPAQKQTITQQACQSVRSTYDFSETQNQIHRLYTEFWASSKSRS